MTDLEDYYPIYYNCAWCGEALYYDQVKNNGVEPLCMECYCKWLDTLPSEEYYEK